MEIQRTLANYDELFSRFVFSDEGSSHLTRKVFGFEQTYTECVKIPLTGFEDL